MNFELCDEECKLESLSMYQDKRRKEDVMDIEGLQKQLAEALRQINCLTERLSFLETEYAELQLNLDQVNYRLDEVTEMLQNGSY